MKKINSKVGSIFTWYDFIRPRKDKSTGILTYSQSNTQVDKYSQRYIGLHIDYNDNIYVAVAVNKKNDPGNWWKFILESRIDKIKRSGGDVGPEDKGVTMVPFRYSDLLYKDQYTYLNLYGAIDSTYLSMAIKSAMANNNQLLDSYTDSRNDKARP